MSFSIRQPDHITVARRQVDNFVLGSTEVCCTCGLRGGQCLEAAQCHYYQAVTKRGLVFSRDET